MEHAQRAERAMQGDLEETGFVLVDTPEPEEAEEDKVRKVGPYGINTPSDKDSSTKASSHYEDKKLVSRLRGTPGFDEAHVMQMLPFVRRDPSLIEDLQDMENAAHFQSIAREPERAEQILKEHPKLKEIFLKIAKVKQDFEVEKKMEDAKQ